jgi:NAD(P)-dependent dehydrogenase (short-subunit alcohol dehydrogenase family)
VSRIAVITGGSSGIGKALGKVLVARGAHVVLAARTATAVERAADELTAMGPGKAWGEVLDVRDAGEVAELVRAVQHDHGRLDLMVNNAGISVGGLIEEMAPEHWDAVYETNVRGVLNGIFAAYPLMIEQGFGQIANTASVFGLIPTVFTAPYAMSKSAVVSLTLALRLEAERHAVRVNVICPGVVETPLLDTSNPKGLPPLEHGVPDQRAFLRRGVRTGISDPDSVAADIVRDLDKNKAIIVRPSSARWLWLTYRLSPALTLAYARRFAAWGAPRLAR